MTDLKQLHLAVLTGNADLARIVTEAALEEAIPPLTLVDDFMAPAMTEAGRQFELGEYFVPELLRSARAMKTAMALLRPLLAKSGAKPLGRIVLGTVAGDVHEIGKNLVGAMLEGAGFTVHDLGTGVPPERFVNAAREIKPHVLGMSALLTTTMPAMKTTLEALTQAGVRNEIKVLIGGAPVSAGFADEIGADGFSNSAAGAVAAAKLVLGLPVTPAAGVHLFQPRHPVNLPLS